MRKQPNKIVSTSDLPNWFSLDAYLPVINFGAAEWVNVITKRLIERTKHIYDGHPDGALWWLYERSNRDLINKFWASYPEAERELDRAPPQALKVFEQATHDQLNILSREVSNFRCTSLWQASRYDIYGAYKFSKIKKKIDGTFDAIRIYNKSYNPYLEHIATTRGKDRLANQLEPIKSIAIKYRKIKTNRNNAAEFLYTKYDEAPYALVKVLPEASDEELVECFKEWLKHWRKNHPYNAPAKVFTENDFSKWRRYQLLAYFDLRMWAELEGIKISDNVLISALFPSEEIGANDRIKLLKQWHDKIFCTRTVNALALQAGMEPPEWHRPFAY